MGKTDLQRSIEEQRRRLRASIAEQYRQIRADAGLSLRAVGGAAEIHPGHVQRIEQAARQPSLDTMVAIATVLGHDVSIRLYPSSEPRLRDHIQARMIEALLQVLHRRWHARLEVPVYQPTRGVIDLVLHDRVAALLVAGEGHSQLRATEHQVRRANEKADALPSARGWPWADSPVAPDISRLLLLRNSEANRAIVRSLPSLFQAAYPGRTRDAFRALTGAEPWPGAAVVWVDVAGARTRVLHGPPRGLLW